MVRKLVVLLSSTLFYSTQTIAGKDHTVKFEPYSINIFEYYRKSYWHNSCLRNKNSFRSHSLLHFTQKTDHLYYVTEITSAGLDAGLISGLQRFLVFDNKKYYNYYLKSLKLNDINKEKCNGDIFSIESNPGKSFYGDFNGDNITDLMYIPNIPSFTPKSLILYGKKIKNIELKKYPQGQSFITVRLYKTELPINNKYQGPFFHNISHLITDWTNANITIQDRNKDGRDDLLITLPGAPDLIAYAAPNGSFPKAEVDTGIGKYNGPSLYKSRFCNRALLTQHPNQNPSTVLFDDICQTAYVSPPQFGQAEVTQLTPNPEKQAFCPAFVGVLDKKQKILDDLVSVANRYTENVASLEVDDSLAVHSAAKREAKKQLTFSEQQESNIRLQLESAQLALAEASFALEVCGNCSVEQTAVNNAKTQVNALNQQLDKAVLSRRAKQQAYDEALAIYQRERERLVQLDTELMALLAEYEALKQKETTLFNEYAAAEGATAQVRYPLNWPAQINHYQQRNARLKVNWKPLPLTGLKLIARLPEHPETPMGNKNLSLPYVLYANINDSLTGYEPSLMPTGNTVINNTLRKYPTDPITVPDALTGTVGISLGGYCSLYAPENNQPVNHQQIAQQVAPTLHYEYEQQVKRGYTAKYKLDTFVKTIVRTKKKKKWFKKKKKTYIERKVITKDWFDIKFDATSGEYAYSPTEQDQITREVKSDLVRRVNTAIGALYADNSQCKNNQDCSYGYWLGQLANNTDDTRAIQQFKQGNSKWVEETVYGIRYRPKTGWVGFK